LDFRSG